MVATKKIENRGLKNLKSLWMIFKLQTKLNTNTNRETNRYSSEKTLRDVSHDNTDEEDNSLQRLVSQDEGEDEECDSKEDGYTRHDVDEMFDLNSDRSFWN